MSVSSHSLLQDADVVALVPKAWEPIIDASMRVSNMKDMRHWAVNTARHPMQDNSPELVKKVSAQQNLHVFQGVPMADYNLVGMLARMIALGVILRPSDIYEHKPGDYNQTHYQKEATSKITLFELTEYKRILYLDADGLVLHNLDSVFNLQAAPVALLAARNGAAYDTRVMLLQPSKQLHAQLQFILEKETNKNDLQVLTEYFSEKVQELPASLALQTYELRIPNRQRASGTASMLLHEALYVHFFDSPEFPKHWQWTNPSRVPKLLPTCTETCDERMPWLYVYSMLAVDREGVCIAGR